MNTSAARPDRAPSLPPDLFSEPLLKLASPCLPLAALPSPHFFAAPCLLPASLLPSARERGAHPRSSTPSTTVSAGTLGWVPGGRGLKAQPSPEGLTPRTMLLDSPGDTSFPTTEKLEGTEELPEAAHHHGKGKPTTPPFIPGRRNSKKGRKKNWGPCNILTGEAGGTQGTSDGPCRAHVELLVPRLFTLHRRGHKPHVSLTQGNIGRGEK